MILDITVSADIEQHAREQAVKLAHAQGYPQAQPLFVRKTAPRTYAVTLNVTVAPGR